MNNVELARNIRCELFAERDTLVEAFEYAHEVFKGDARGMTALYVVLNTLANTIIANENAKETV